jgi:two-component system NtrC family sensor kinase
MHRLLERQLRKTGIGTEPPTAAQWALLLDRIDHVYTAADQDRYTLERALDLSSAEMRKRFSELRDAQGQLVLASRKAGMADVATDVLHNVGNVLNSVNVSANTVAQVVKGSARNGLSKSLALLATQPAPGKFLDEDPRGKKVIPYLTAVDKALGEERDVLLRETDSLAKHIEHIKSIVGQQLSVARGEMRGAMVVDQVNICELFDDAVGVLMSSGDSAQELTFVYDSEPIVLATDRHKVFQIVTNLLANARDAVTARPGASGVITLRARRMPDQRVAIEVDDDGIGIAEDTLARIFSHGFTTKEDGHGFGLHSSANAATELGGSLNARSKGLGCGATFTLVVSSVRPATQNTGRPRAASMPRAESNP